MPAPGKADQATVRRHNASMVLNELRLNASMSRADLSKRTGLNRSTISSIVSQLLEQDLVIETDYRGDRIGRPGLLLELNIQGSGVVGVEIGPTHVHVLLANLSADVLWRRRILVGEGEPQDTYLHIAEEMIRQALTSAEERDLRVFGIGLALPGMVDARQGELRYSPVLRWRDVPLGRSWAERFRLPVFVENNANAGAIGEYYFGTARDVANFVYLAGDDGIGGGIVLGGELLRGRGGFAGEIGHMAIVPDGHICSCGRRGCWETVAGPRAVVADYEQRARAMNANIRLDVDTMGLGAVAGAAELNDLAANAALQEAARYLGIGIANLVNIFNPQMVILGGAFSEASEPLVPRIRETVKDNSLFPMRSALSILPSQHGSDDCIMGAVALVFDHVLRTPL